MTGQFDERGDLWIEVDLNSIPQNSAGLHLSATATFYPSGNGGFGATKLNLTSYIRRLMKPDWVNAALTSASAKISVNGQNA